MTKKVTLLFPGQGSQYVGMGKDLDSELLKQADGALGYDLSKIMLEGPEEDLKLTRNTQPAILTHSIMLLNKLLPILEKKGIEIERVLGHSVGEYGALVAAEAISFEDAVQAVNLRGMFMQEAVPAGVGAMYAIMKVSEEDIIKACAHASKGEEKVMPANFNSPDQIVISGGKNACAKAVKWLEENLENPFRAVELQVSAPFHSSLMKPAREKLEKHLNEVQFADSKVNYIANIDAKEYPAGTSKDIIRKNLVEQVDGSVLWTQSFKSLADDTVCIEVGPGRVLMGLARKINRNIKVISLDKEGAFDAVEEL